MIVSVAMAILMAAMIVIVVAAAVSMTVVIWDEFVECSVAVADQNQLGLV